jgi:hypothetical protein
MLGEKINLKPLENTMVFDYKILPIQTQAIDAPEEVRGFLRHRKPLNRKQKKNRRKSGLDRRADVRDGVIVDLSYKNNRRKIRDRRNTSGERKAVGSRAMAVV